MVEDISSERCMANPIFIEEVNLYLKERFKNDSINLGEEVFNESTKKVIKYCLKFCYLKKDKVKKIRNYINGIKENSILNNEEIVQAEIILCKIIDLNPSSYKILLTLLPGHKRYFTQNQFRKHYNKLHSIMNI